MRSSLTILLGLSTLAAADDQIPLLDKVKGFFAKASAVVTSKMPVSSFGAVPVEAATKLAQAIQYPLTLENWKEVLTVDPTVSPPTTQDWLVFVTGGNKTCFGFCGNATKAWNASLPFLAARPNAPSFAYLDCETESVLCNSWSVGAPSLYYFQIPKPLADQSAPVPSVRYKPLNRTSTTIETFKTLVLNNEIEQIELYEGVFHPFNGLMQQFQLAVPYGYFIWAFSKMPSWLPMILVSFLSRTFMGKRMAPSRPQAAPGIVQAPPKAK